MQGTIAKSGNLGKGSDGRNGGDVIDLLDAVTSPTDDVGRPTTMPINIEKLRSRVRSTNRIAATVSKPMAVVWDSSLARGGSSVSTALTTLLAVVARIAGEVARLRQNDVKRDASQKTNDDGIGDKTKQPAQLEQPRGSHDEAGKHRQRGDGYGVPRRIACKALQRHASGDREACRWPRRS